MFNIEDTKKRVSERLTAAVSEIQASMQANGINASGRTSASFRVETMDSGVRLIAGGEDTAPIGTLEVGRTGGKVPAGFTDILEQWSRDKGLVFETESRRKSFAYLLGRKIARDGTQRSREPQDVYSSIAQQAAVDIKNVILAQLTDVVVGQVVHNFKKQ